MWSETLAGLVVSSLRGCCQRMRPEHVGMHYRIAEHVERIGFVCHKGGKHHGLVQRADRSTAENASHTLYKDCHSWIYANDLAAIARSWNCLAAARRLRVVRPIQRLSLQPAQPQTTTLGINLRASFLYCITPGFLGGDGEECSLLVRSVNGTRIRTRDSRPQAYAALLEVLPRFVLEDPRVAGEIELSPATPVNFAAVTARSANAFQLLQILAQEACYTAVTFRRQDGLLDFYAG